MILDSSLAYIYIVSEKMSICRLQIQYLDTLYYPTACAFLQLRKSY